MAPAPDGARVLRLGIFGGTFDPPHVGHSSVATEVADALKLDRIVWIPAGNPPHKRQSVIADHAARLEMVQAATGEDPRFEASDLELNRAGPSYTVDTLRIFRAEHPDADIFLILGSDQLENFGSGWKEPEAILRLACLVILDRGGRSAPAVAPLLPGMERSIHVDITRVDVSSTDVRSRVARGQSLVGMVVPAVEAVIRRRELYALRRDQPG